MSKENQMNNILYFNSILYSINPETSSSYAKIEVYSAYINLISQGIDAINANIESICDNKIFAFWDVDEDNLANTLHDIMEICFDIHSIWKKNELSKDFEISTVFEFAGAWREEFALKKRKWLLHYGGKVSLCKLSITNSDIYSNNRILVGSKAYEFINHLNFKDTFDYSYKVQPIDFFEEEDKFYSIIVNDTQ